MTEETMKEYMEGKGREGGCEGELDEEGKGRGMVHGVREA